MSAPAYPSLTAILHEMVKHAPSGLTARTIADLLGKDYQTLMSELSRQPGHKLGADLLLPLMDLTGSDAPLNFLARERGGVFVPVPPNNNAADLAPAILASVKEFGEFTAEAAGGALCTAPGAKSADERGFAAEHLSRANERIKAAAQDIADGHIPAPRLARILKEGQEAATAIVTFMEMARAVHQRQYGSRRSSPGGR